MRACPMRYPLLMIAFALATPRLADAGPLFTIRAETERTGTSASRDPYSDRVSLSSVSITTIRYTFQIRASALAPATAQAEWVLMADDNDGEPYETARGQASLTFPRNARHDEIHTPPVTLSSYPGASSQGSLVGYAIRLTDEAGQLLAEKYSPANLRSRIVWTAPAHAPAPPPPRPTVPMPMVF
ncbi:MAG: hypothetical protein K8T26_17005 [Lentisphaerae bacterium]|nr:hypothetical protein [Lentisphaerota bacterium]